MVKCVLVDIFQLLLKYKWRLALENSDLNCPFQQNFHFELLCFDSWYGLLFIYSNWKSFGISIILVSLLLQTEYYLFLQDYPAASYWIKLCTEYITVSCQWHHKTQRRSKQCSCVDLPSSNHSLESSPHHHQIYKAGCTWQQSWLPTHR